MKKNNLFILLSFLLLIIVFAPLTIHAQGLVPNPTGPNGSYSICDFFTMLLNIYNFILLMIATPLAVIAIIIGAIFMMISAGNPQLMGTGKKILWAAIIGLVLVFASYLIINTVLSVLGYTGNWATLSCS